MSYSDDFLNFCRKLKKKGRLTNENFLFINKIISTESFLTIAKRGLTLKIWNSKMTAFRMLLPGLLDKHT